MSDWSISRTDTFLKQLKEHKNNHELLRELDNKIKCLKEDALTLGGYLSGELHGLKSTRLTRKYRLIFSADTRLKVVHLVALDHRGKIY